VKLFNKNTDTDLIVVAEIGVNHEGSTERAVSLIDSAMEAGADAVKIQVGTTAGRERKGASFSLNEMEIRRLARRCRILDIPLFASALDLEAVELCAELFPVIKIASRDFHNVPLLTAVQKTGLPAIASIGERDLDAVVVVTELLKDRVAILHTVPEYPAEDPNLEDLELLQVSFGKIPIGYSNHCKGLWAPYRAVAKGACIIELHFTDDKTREFRDHHLSVEADELREFVAHASTVRDCLGGVSA